MCNRGLYRENAFYRPEAGQRAFACTCGAQGGSASRIRASEKQREREREDEFAALRKHPGAPVSFSAKIYSTPHDALKIRQVYVRSSAKNGGERGEACARKRERESEEGVGRRGRRKCSAMESTVSRIEATS